MSKEQSSKQKHREATAEVRVPDYEYPTSGGVGNGEAVQKNMRRELTELMG